MNAQSESFLAELLSTAASGFASSAAALLAERPGPAAARGFTAWRDTFAGWVRELGGSLRSRNPVLFGTHMAWVRGALLPRGVERDELLAATRALFDALEQGLPEGAQAALERYQAAAEDALTRQDSDAGSFLAGSSRGDVALRWLEELVGGDARGALAVLLAEIDAGRATPAELILDVLEPAQQEIGRLWHRLELSIGEEHFGTRTTRRALGALLDRTPAPPPDAPLVLLSCVEGDMHDIGLALLGALLEIEGWRVVELGADLPAAALAQSARQLAPQLVAVSATLGQQRDAVTRAVEAARTAAPGAKVMVGGGAFAGGEELWRSTGADGYSASLREAVATARTLLA